METMGIYEIKLRIRSESELYNPLDADELVISDNVTSYISGRYREKNFRDKLILNIFSEEDVDLSKLRAALERYIEGERTALWNETQKNRVKQIWMFVIGAVLIAIRVYAPPQVPVIEREIISTVGAFSLWEAASIWIVKNPAAALRKRWFKAISDTEIKLTRI